MRYEGGGQVAAGRGTHDANAMGIHFVIRRMGPHPAHGPGGILQHGRMTVAVGTKTVFQHKTGDALLVQPERVIIAFMRGQVGITAAGTDDHGGTGGIGAGRQIGGKRRDVVSGIAQRAGRAFRPEGNGRLHLCAGDKE